jgi:hypothetical protein
MLICSFAKNKSTSCPMQQAKDHGPDAHLFLCKEQINSCQMQQTKDHGPDANLFLCKEQIDFVPDAADQRPRTIC